MIIFKSPPALVQDNPIIGWMGTIAQRGGEHRVRLHMDFSFEPSDAPKVSELTAIVRSIMEGAEYPDGEKLRPGVIATLEAANGEKVVVPAKMLPEEMLMTKAPETPTQPTTEGATMSSS